MDKMIDQVTHTKIADSRWGWLYKPGGAAALTCGALLLLGLLSLIVSVLQPGGAKGWLAFFESIWLIKIFKLHAGFSGVTADILHRGLNPLDIIILALVGVMCAGLSVAFEKRAKTWSLIACGLALVAIGLYAATQNAGRSTVMLAVLIISFAMRSSEIFGKGTIVAGILAGVFLFIGDLTVGMQSSLITSLFGIGYLLLIAWFFLVAQRVLRPGQGVSQEKLP
jgi:hypothetical protein